MWRKAPSRAKPISCCRPIAGPEIGVASTKAFTCQLAALAAFAIAAGEARGTLERGATRRRLCTALLETPRHIAEFLKQEAEDRRRWARKSPRRATCSIWAAAPSFPLALEGALKLKEISYIHAEGYAAGEMKHGPIALIDEKVPIIVIAPHDALFEKTISNMQEVMARGGKVLLISDARGVAEAGPVWASIRCPTPIPSSRRCSTPFRCSCWPITPPSPRARMWISRAIWRRS